MEGSGDKDLLPGKAAVLAMFCIHYRLPCLPSLDLEVMWAGKDFITKKCDSISVVYAGLAEAEWPEVSPQPCQIIPDTPSDLEDESET